MLAIDVQIDNLDKLQNHIKLVEKMAKMKTDSSFQQYIKNKVLETVNQVSTKRLVGGTTNDEYISEYILRNKIRDEADGFVLYNDFTIPYILTTRNTKNQDRDFGVVRNYDNGFNIALAFEYGVGIVGMTNPVTGAWDYNINNYEKGWFYNTREGDTLFTQGYQGFEIYRYTAEEIIAQLPKWVNDYFAQNGGVS